MKTFSTESTKEVYNFLTPFLEVLCNKCCKISESTEIIVNIGTK